MQGLRRRLRARFSERREDPEQLQLPRAEKPRGWVALMGPCGLKDRKKLSRHCWPFPTVTLRTPSKKRLQNFAVKTLSTYKK